MGPVFSPFLTVRRQLLQRPGRESFAGQSLIRSKPERKSQRREKEGQAKRHPNLMPSPRPELVSHLNFEIRHSFTFSPWARWKNPGGAEPSSGVRGGWIRDKRDKMGRGVVWNRDALPQDDPHLLRGPLAFPDRPSLPHLTNPTSQLRSKGPLRLKTWSPTGYGANGSYYERAPGAWEPSKGWAGAC